MSFFLDYRFNVITKLSRDFSEGMNLCKQRYFKIILHRVETLHTLKERLKLFQFDKVHFTKANASS